MPAAVQAHRIFMRSKRFELMRGLRGGMVVSGQRGQRDGSGLPTRLDSHTRLHLRRFADQVALLVLCCTPALLVDKDAPILFLSLLRAVSCLTAVALFIGGWCYKVRPTAPRLGPWDHCLGFVLLQVGCSIALHLIR
jgi:hypothetical protein